MYFSFSASKQLRHDTKHTPSKTDKFEAVLNAGVVRHQNLLVTRLPNCTCGVDHARAAGSSTLSHLWDGKRKPAAELLVGGGLLFLDALCRQDRELGFEPAAHRTSHLKVVSTINALRVGPLFGF